MNRHGSVLSGILFAILATAFFGVLDTTTKYISTAVPAMMALWFRFLFQAVATAAWVLPRRGRLAWRTRQPGYQLLRGALMLGCSLLAFTSLKYMPVGEFTAIVMVAPLAITVLAATVLHEKVSALRWLLVTGGFIGTLIIIRPGGETFTWASLLPLCLVGGSAWFQVLTSKLARTENPLTVHLYTGWTGALIATVALPFVWVTLPDPRLWLLLCLAGAAGAVSHFLLIVAYQRAPASTLVPYLYAQIAFGMLGGWLVFSHVPDAWALAGIAMIAVCGALGAWLTVRESRVVPQSPEV